jgi:hypothetical protein
MTIDDALQYFGGQAPWAQAMQSSPQRINNWCRHGQIPLLAQYQIEALTNGKLKRDADSKPRAKYKRPYKPRAKSAQLHANAG